MHEVLDRTFESCQRALGEVMDAQAAMQSVNLYFAQLNDYEKYAWIVALLGFLLAMTGIALLFL